MNHFSNYIKKAETVIHLFLAKNRSKISVSDLNMEKWILNFYLILLADFRVTLYLFFKYLFVGTIATMVWIPKVLCWNPNPHCDGVRCSGGEEVMKGRALVDGISVLIREAPESALAHSSMGSIIEGRQPLTRPWTPGHLHLEFPRLHNCGKYISVFLKPLNLQYFVVIAQHDSDNCWCVFQNIFIPSVLRTLPYTANDQKYLINE